MRKTTRILSIVLVLLMLVGLMPSTALADRDVGARVTYADGRTEDCSTFPQAWNKATASNNATVTLFSNWDGGRFVVPEDKTVTLELNGWVLTRNLSSGKSDGEVLYVSDNATLNVYGGTKSDPAANADHEHSVWVYRARGDRYAYTRDKITLKGGIINGGHSSDAGGGIHMKENAKVYLYHVTIAGNRASAKTVEYGDGGGIEMDNKYGYVYMEDSQIIYNCARYDGGGIHVDSDYCKVDMVRSRIDHNVADDNGGGIYVDGDHFVLRGDAKQILDPEAAINTYHINDWTGAWDYMPDVNALGSSISYNCVFDSEDGGGGIYMDNEYGLIDGINFFGNITTDDYGAGNGDGGAIYLDEEEITVSNCNILRNKADERGGGIHVRGDDNIVDFDDNTVSNCTVYRNLAWDANGAGGGIFVYKYCDLILKGTIIVSANTSKTFGDDNLYLSTDGNSVDAYIIPEVSPRSDIHIRLSANGTWEHGAQITRDPGTYDASLFTYDNKDSEDCLHHGHIGWDSDWNDRQLKVVSGAKPEKPQTEEFEPTNPDGRTRDAGSYTVDDVDYLIIKGVFSYPSFPDDDADIENVFYYSDGFFAGDTHTYNAQLATLSMCLAGAAGYSNEYGKDDSKEDYLDKSQNFRQFVSDIGCTDENIYVNDFNVMKPDADTIGVGIASKDITIAGVRKKLVIIGVRGMGYEKEWISNMTLGASGEAAGWASAANQVFAELRGYLARKDIDGTSEDTIFWIAGYSRGGATANLTAKRIVDAYDHNGTHTFAYPLEAPKGGVASEKVAGNNYNCIHNIINQNDIVPWTGTTEMGFIRYGVDHYVPGEPTVNANPTEGSDHILKDNTAWDVTGNTDGHGGRADYKDTGYYQRKNKMVEQLQAVNPDIIFDDYYHRATISFVNGGNFQDARLIAETNGREIVGADTEAFVAKFFECLQDWAFGYTKDGKELKPGDAYYRDPRGYFSSYQSAGSKTFQQAAAAFAGVIFGMSGDQKTGLINSMNGLLDRIDSLSSLYFDLDKGGIADGGLLKQLKSIWQLITNPNSTQIAKGQVSIKNFISDEDFSKLNSSYIALLYPILCLAGHDYSNNKSALLGTAAYNIPRIIANHYPEVTHSWLRSYDYLYENDGTNPVVMPESAKPAPSAVALELIHSDGTTEKVTPTDNQIITVYPDDVVRMLPSNPDHVNTGEAIYYRYTQGPAYFRDYGVHAYSDPLDIADLIDTHSWNGKFSLKITSAHHGVKRDWISVQLVLEGNATVSVPLGYQNGDYPNGQYIYGPAPLQIGERYTFSPKVLVPGGSMSGTDPAIEQGYRFKGWEVYEYTPGTSTSVDDGIVGDPISPEYYFEYFGSDFDPSAYDVTVVNKKGVSARFVPIYERDITSIDVELSVDTSDLPLPDGFRWKETGEASYRDNYVKTICWYEDDGKYVGTFTFALEDDERIDDGIAINYTYATEQPSGFAITDTKVYMEMRTETSGSTPYVSVVMTCTSPVTVQEFENKFPNVFGAKDLNTNAVQTYRYLNAYNGVVPPVLENMKWVGADEPTQCYTYQPVVNAVTITLDEPLVAGELMPKLDSAVVTVGNDWRIDTAQLAWFPPNTLAGSNKEYAASIKVNMQDIMGTNISVPGSESQSLAGVFSFADDLTITVEDAAGTAIPITSHIFTVTDEFAALFLVFNRTEKLEITGFADIGVTVAHGSSESQIRAALPTEVYAYLENGMMVSVSAAWNDVDSVDPDDPDEQIVTAYGRCTDNDYTVADGVSPTATVTVKEAERTTAPVATPASGIYEGVLSVALEADEDAEIRYAIRTLTLSEYYTEETDPDTGETITVLNPNLDVTLSEDAEFETYDAPIVLNEYDTVYLLYAYAEKDGLRDSILVTYRYELRKPEVLHLEAKDPMIAEDGNIECWYSYQTKDDEIIPNRYYANEGCTEVLDYKTQVLIPAFIATTHTAAEGDAVAECVKLYEEEQVIFGGFDTLGVQEIGSDGQTARVLTVLDARIIRDATDYGYLFTTADAEPTYDAAQYKYSCVDTTNNLYNGDYCYVTAKIGGSFLDEDLRVCFYVKLENGTDYIYTDAVACTPTISGTGMPDNVQDNITLTQSIPKFKSHSLVLSGQIGVIFFLDLPTIDGVDYADSYMTFEISGAGEVSSDPVPFDPTQTNASGVLYGFTCYVASIQMADTVTATFHYGEDLTVSETYSIKQYIESFDTYIEKYPGVFNEETINLVHALADYGHYVQLYLESVKGWTLGTGDDQYAPMELCYREDCDVEAVAEAVADCGIVRDNNSADIQKITYSVRLDSDTAIQVYFKPVKNYSGSFTVTLDGEPYTATKQSDGRYLVEIPNIGAHQLGTTYTIVATTDAGIATVEVSVLSYVKGMLTAYAGNANAENAACAIYYYNVAAQAYMALQQ